ncbi:MAG: flagellar export chaperone FlgN [bacterium]
MKQYLDNIEEILDKEIDAYSVLEKHVSDKKELLVQNKVELLENVDTEIIQQTTKVANLAKARQQQCIYVERIDLTFSELIAKTFEVDEVQAERFTEKKDKLESIVFNIQSKNNINAKLIQNSLLIMNKTIEFILKMLAPELDSYNQLGQMKKTNENYKMSSIEQEA